MEKRTPQEDFALKLEDISETAGERTHLLQILATGLRGAEMSEDAWRACARCALDSWVLSCREYERLAAMCENAMTGAAYRPEDPAFHTAEELALLLVGAAERVRAYGRRIANVTELCEVDALAAWYRLHFGAREMVGALDALESAEAESHEAGRLL